MLVRNYDYPASRLEGIVYLTRWGERRVIGMSDCLWGLLDGINDAGLAISLTFGDRVRFDGLDEMHRAAERLDAPGSGAAPELETVIRPYDWNDMLISVHGNRYVVYLNGMQMIDFTYPSPGATEGVIALQLHSGGEGRMRFKDIQIRDLAK